MTLDLKKKGKHTMDEIKYKIQKMDIKFIRKVAGKMKMIKEIQTL